MNLRSSFANVFRIGRGGAGQRENSFADHWLQFMAAAGNVFDNLAPHPWIPEIPQMVRNPRNCLLVIRIAGKVRADIVRHHDQVIEVHGSNLESAPRRGAAGI
jgi:hypothetical protein